MCATNQPPNLHILNPNISNICLRLLRFKRGEFLFGVKTTIHDLILRDLSNTQNKNNIHDFMIVVGTHIQIF